MISVHMLGLAVLLTMIGAKKAQISDNAEGIVCNGLIFDGAYYDKNLIFQGTGASYNLMMHHPSEELFFSHSIRNLTTLQYDHGFKACYIHNKTCRDIKGIVTGSSIAYDNENDNIYFGSFEGLYRYDKIKKTAVYYAERNKAVWALCYFKTLFYVQYPSQQLFVLKSGTFMKSRIKAEVFVFYAMYKYFYYSNRSGLYKLDRRDMENVIVLQNRIAIKQITQDINGQVYFCATDGIYVEDKPFYKIKKIADIKDAQGMTFINSITANAQRFLLIYSSENNIYQLVPSKYGRVCLEDLLNTNLDERMKRNKPTIYVNLKLDLL